MSALFVQFLEFASFKAIKTSYNRKQKNYFIVLFGFLKNYYITIILLTKVNINSYLK